MTHNIQSLCHRPRNFSQTAGGLLAMLIILLISLQVFAGSPIGELQYRFPCEMNGWHPEITYEHRRDPITVGMNIGYGGKPILVVNEREVFEQPFIVVAFEYLSACEQVREVVARNLGKSIDDPQMAREMVFRADCRAISRMQREGLLRSSKDYSTIKEVFEYERARLDYLGISFNERIRNIRDACPF